MARTVGELKDLIADLPDDMPIFTFGGDHEAFRAGVSTGHVTYWKQHNIYNEFFSDEDMLDVEEKIAGLLIWD
jgi:hypothetical protein